MKRLITGCRLLMGMCTAHVQLLSIQRMAIRSGPGQFAVHLEDKATAEMASVPTRAPETPSQFPQRGWFQQSRSLSRTGKKYSDTTVFSHPPGLFRLLPVGL